MHEGLEQVREAGVAEVVREASDHSKRGANAEPLHRRLHRVLFRASCC